MEQRLKVLILGYGEMGQAMTYLLNERNQIYIWSRHPKEGIEFVVLEEAVALADVIFFCLPVNPHREVLQKIAPLLKEHTLCISIAKGLNESGQTAEQIFADILKLKGPYALLYGPMISEEIRAGRNAFAQVGCHDLAWFSTVQDLFNSTPLYLQHTFDISGISWSVILKNVYALVFGIADELQLGDNMRGYLAVAALCELDKIVRSMGGQEGSPYHLAGLGDLITTATSEDSHHHEVGRILAMTNVTLEKKKELNGEGLHTIKMIKKYNIFNIADYPLFQLIDNIVQQPNDVDKKINDYLQKEQG